MFKAESHSTRNHLNPGDILFTEALASEKYEIQYLYFSLWPQH